MKVVEPIRNKDHIAAIKASLLEQGEYRNHCLFVFGINIGLRIGDLERLMWTDVLHEDGVTFKQYVDIYGVS